MSVHDGKDASGASDTTIDDTIAVTITITVTDVDEAGTAVLSAVQPLVGTVLTASLTDLDGAVTDGTFTDLSGNGGGHGQLHTGCRRRGQLPAGHGVLHRPPGFGQERIGGVGERGAGRAVDQHGA